MPCDVNDIIGPRHDIEITIFINHPGITGFIIARKGGEIRFNETIGCVPQGGQRARGERQLYCNSAQLSDGHLMSPFIQNLHIIARHGHGWGANLDRHGLNTRRIAGDGKASFGLPPVIIDGHAHNLLGPFYRVWIGPFTCQIERAQSTHIEFLNRIAF